ncbi:spore germination protein (plasmid) [Bacillus toyonensis]
MRSIMQPTTEKIIHGAHNGFIENSNTNLNTIQSRILNSNLKISYFNIGKSTVKMTILYIKRTANDTIVHTK